MGKKTKTSAVSGAAQGRDRVKISKKSSKLSIFPSDQRLLEMRNKLPEFAPHDVQSLIEEARGNNEEELYVYRRRTVSQLNELLKFMSIDPSRSDAHSRGFFRLAQMCCGTGRLASYRNRTNRSAATWTFNHDMNLLREVTILQGKGFTQRGAVKKLVADKSKRRLFPYREHRRVSAAGEQQRREAALWARLQKLKASVRGKFPIL
jgi:hypothetical protein